MSKESWARWLIASGEHAELEAIQQALNTAEWENAPMSAIQPLMGRLESAARRFSKERGA